MTETFGRRTLYNHNQFIHQSKLEKIKTLSGVLGMSKDELVRIIEIDASLMEDIWGSRKSIAGHGPVNDFDLLLSVLGKIVDYEECRNPDEELPYLDTVGIHSQMDRGAQPPWEISGVTLREYLVRMGRPGLRAVRQWMR